MDWLLETEWLSHRVPHHLLTEQNLADGYCSESGGGGVTGLGCSVKRRRSTPTLVWGQTPGATLGQCDTPPCPTRVHFRALSAIINPSACLTVGQ